MKQPSSLQKVLIFGGAGFIGSNWTQYLLKYTEATVHIFDNLSRRGVRHNLAALQQAAGRTGRLQITVGDVRDAAAVKRATCGATEIYNFAAQVAVTTSIQDPRQDFEINTLGTFNILEAARTSGACPFILFTSTNKVYGNIEGRPLRHSERRYEYQEPGGIAESQPLDFHSPYGCSKGAADQYVRDYARIYGLPTVVFRMSCIAGPRQFGTEDQGWVAHFLYSALSGTPIVIYGDGRQVRDVLCVHDLLRAFLMVRAGQPQTGGQIYNVGGGPQNTTSLLELIDLIEQLTGARLLYKCKVRRPGDQLVYVSDIRKLEHDAGWSPRYDVAQTVGEIYEWWKQNRELFAASAKVSPPLAVPALQPVPESRAS